MKRKTTRAAAWLLTVCLLAALLTAPAGASSAGGFSDVTDAGTAASVECLRLLGVLDGYPDGTFRPGNSLTRAQFCKMAVYAMNGSSQVGQYKAYTVYPDVMPSYWAAPYINMASKGKSIILGYPDGQFYPNRTVSYGQAVTILMRLLGYADADVGAVWPDGYLAAAKTAGLTNGLNLFSGAVLTRGYAARLFANLLSCKMKDGSAYAKSISTGLVSDVVLLSSSATASDGTAGAMKASDGNTYKMANRQSNGLLNGHKGTLLLDQNNQVLTFVPTEKGTCKTVTVAVAKAESLKDSTGATYTLSGSVTAYADGKQQTWGEIYSWLLAGNSVTLYQSPSGGIEYVYVGSNTVTATGAVIVSTKGSTTGFSDLADNTNYTITKDGVPATSADLRQYDVATYNSANNTIQVCDTRISGRLENCWPNMDAPSKVTVLGHEFNVLSSAAGQFSNFKLGDQVALLLTEDNQVAGAIAASGLSGSGNAIGMVTSLSESAVTVHLLCGITVSGIPEDTLSGGYNGQLVTVSSVRTGYLSLASLSGSTSSDLNVAGRKLGRKTLAENIVIYEKIGDSTMTAISLSDISDATVPGTKVVYEGDDWAGRVNLLILNDATGNEYTYGRAKVVSGDSGRDMTVSYGNGQSVGPLQAGSSISSGDFVGVAVSAADSSKVAGLVKLTEVADVPSSAWTGRTLVSAGGRTYSVAENVVCYNKSADTFVSLSTAHAFAEKCNLYVDCHNVVRAIEVS